VPCGRPVKKLPGDDPLPCGSRLYWNFGQVGATRLEILLCEFCIQKEKDDEIALEEATKPS
jgi:hypothetical protein